jgi:DNA-binding FadR family transcriptional regulator
MPIEQCTLDVLGPLLDLELIPNPVLVDQVLEMFGVLMNVASRDALERATPTQWKRFERLAVALYHTEVDHAHRHEALRELGDFLVEVSDHLVLRLMMNGLRTTFIGRVQRHGIEVGLDSGDYRHIAVDLQQAARARDIDSACGAMQRINRFFRDSVAAALTARSASRIRA